MTTPLRVTAAVLLCVGVTAACVRTTDGTVAMTTQPGAPQDGTSAPAAPGEPGQTGAMTMTCEDFIELDSAEQLEVVSEILDSEESTFAALGETLAASIANMLCQFTPQVTVAEVLAGAPPR